MQRLTQVEADVAKLSDLKSQMATVEERTGNMVQNMKEMREDMGRITGYILDEARNFTRPEATPRRR